MSSRFPRLILWAGCLLFFALMAANLLQHPLSAPTNQIDEQAHISYAMHLITHGRWWPDFTDFHMVNTTTLKPLTAQNYLNHPPTFYWLMKLFGTPAAIDFRILSVALYAAAMLLYTRIGLKLNLPLIGAIVFTALPFLLTLQLQVGFYNNDAAAMLGGMLATYASLDWFADTKPRRAFWLMVAGIALASVKLTAFLLIGIYVLVCLANGRRHRIVYTDWLFSVLIGLILLMPYAMMLHLTGHLAPETLGQAQLMTPPSGHGWVRTPYSGWAQQVPMGFFQWLAVFISNFADQIDGPELTFLPLLLIVYGFSRMTAPRRRETLLIGVACTTATLLTLILHTIYSWQRYRDHGWLLDSLVRYYFPLLGAYGALCAEVVKGKSHET